MNVNGRKEGRRDGRTYRHTDGQTFLQRCEDASKKEKTATTGKLIRELDPDMSNKLKGNNMILLVSFFFFVFTLFFFFRSSNITFV